MHNTQHNAQIFSCLTRNTNAQPCSCLYICIDVVDILFFLSYFPTWNISVCPYKRVSSCASCDYIEDATSIVLTSHSTVHHSFKATGATCRFHHIIYPYTLLFPWIPPLFFLQCLPYVPCLGGGSKRKDQLFRGQEYAVITLDVIHNRYFILLTPKDDSPFPLCLSRFAPDLSHIEMMWTFIEKDICTV